MVAPLPRKILLARQILPKNKKIKMRGDFTPFMSKSFNYFLQEFSKSKKFGLWKVGAKKMFKWREDI